MTTIRPFARLPVIGASTSVKPYKGADLGMRGGAGGGQLVMDDPEQQEIEKVIGRERAQRVMGLKRKGVQATLPEYCAYDWLERQGYQFQFQSSQLGGRPTHGGAVVDFLIADISRMGWYAWRIQGDYWHTGFEVGVKDDMQKARLRGARIEGIPVVAVVDLWEHRIYDSYPQVFELAEAGLEMGD